MLWTPIGVTVSVSSTVDANGTLFIASSIAALQGQLVARVFNNAATSSTFTLNVSATVSNSKAIPLSAGQDMVIAHSNVQLYIAASSASVQITPGTGRP